MQVFVILISRLSYAGSLFNISRQKEPRVIITARLSVQHTGPVGRSNENDNRMLRRFVSKDIGSITEEELQTIEDWLQNSRTKWRANGGKK